MGTWKSPTSTYSTQPNRGVEILDVGLMNKATMVTRHRAGTRVEQGYSMY
jgi:hypothetical protein